METREVLYHNCKSFYHDFFDEVEKAKVSIDIEMFIWSNDDLGDQVLESLKRAVRRGLRVRLIVDGIGCFYWLLKHRSDVRALGIELRTYHPVRLTLFSSKLNRRNHRKVIIIDNKTVFTGSMNFSEDYMVWRETIVRLEGRFVTPIKILFDYNWQWVRGVFKRDRRELARLEELLRKYPEVHTTDSRFLRKRYRFFLSYLIDQADTKVWLTTPYFNPPRFLLRSLYRAVERGVDVRLLLPKLLDSKLLRWIAQLHYKQLIRKGIKIYEYEPQVLHAKVSLIDNKAIVGTGNLNYRSFYKDLEINLAFKDTAVVREIEGQFRQDLEKSRLIPSDFYPSFYKILVGKLLFLVKASF